MCVYVLLFSPAHGIYYSVTRVLDICPALLFVLFDVCFDMLLLPVVYITHCVFGVLCACTYVGWFRDIYITCVTFLIVFVTCVDTLTLFMLFFRLLFLCNRCIFIKKRYHALGTASQLDTSKH